MTWGVLRATGMGDFMPEAHCTDGKPRATAHYENELDDEQRGQLRAGILTLMARASKKFTSDPSNEPELRPIEDYEKWAEFTTFKTYKSLGSIILLDGGAYGVSAPLKTIIEELEPGVHHFWPIRILMPKGREYPEQYYAMVIDNFLDAFSLEQSKPGAWRQNYSRYAVEKPNKASVSGLALSKSAISGAHIWKEKRLTLPDFFISDVLKSRIDAAGLRIPPKHFQTLETDTSKDKE